MVSTNVGFTNEKNGYDKEQVDNYIKKISEAYQTTYYEYLDVSDKYKSLSEEREKPIVQEQPSANSDIIAKTLINTELLAQKIIAEAQAEATTVIAQANKILADANAETVNAKEAAQRAIDAASAEAAMIVDQARKDVKQARRIMEQAVLETERLLAFQMRDNEILAAA